MEQTQKAKSKYTGTKEIQKKIRELFTYRKISLVLHESGLDHDHAFRKELEGLQLKIYLLDAYLESQWDLDPAEISKYWQGITSALTDMHFSVDETEKLVREIRAYEKIERRCRKDRWPISVPFTKFYTTKSCDVRLIRHLIYRAAPALQQVWNEKAWKYYDQATEVLDDIADLMEDLQTYNANRFLVSWLRTGQRKTEKEYRKRLLRIQQKAEKYFQKHPHAAGHEQLYQWTMEGIEETLQMLNRTMVDHDPAALASSYLLGKMK